MNKLLEFSSDKLISFFLSHFLHISLNKLECISLLTNFSDVSIRSIWLAEQNVFFDRLIK